MQFWQYNIRLFHFGWAVNVATIRIKMRVTDIFQGFDVRSETLITFYRWANFVITFNAATGKQKIFWNSTLRSIQNIVIDEKRQHLIQKISSFIAIGECIGSNSWFMNLMYLLKLINHSLWFYYVLCFLNFPHSFS